MLETSQNVVECTIMAAKECYLSINLSKDIQQLLADNDIRLLPALEAQGIKASPAQMPANGPKRESGLKSPELIILVAATAVPLVATAIARIIDAIGRNTRPVVTRRAWKPILGADGKQMLDKSGQPLMQWEETPMLLEPQHTPQEALGVQTNFLGLEFKLGGGDGAEK